MLPKDKEFKMDSLPHANNSPSVSSNMALLSCVSESCLHVDNMQVFVTEILVCR